MRWGLTGRSYHNSGWPTPLRPGVPAGDRRRLDVVVVSSCTAPRPGALCCDATLVSPLTWGGQPQPGTETDGAVLRVADRRKLAAYPELGRGTPGGWWCLGRRLGAAGTVMPNVSSGTCSACERSVRHLHSGQQRAQAGRAVVDFLSSRTHMLQAPSCLARGLLHLSPSGAEGWQAWANWGRELQHPLQGRACVLAGVKWGRLRTTKGCACDRVLHGYSENPPPQYAGDAGRIGKVFVQDAQQCPTRCVPVFHGTTQSQASELQRQRSACATELVNAQWDIIGQELS